MVVIVVLFVCFTELPGALEGGADPQTEGPRELLFCFSSPEARL